VDVAVRDVVATGIQSDPLGGWFNKTFRDACRGVNDVWGKTDAPGAWLQCADRAQ